MGNSLYTSQYATGYGVEVVNEPRALDFAGGTVVHINCGVSALALALVLGTRKEKTLLPHNLGYPVLGAAFPILWMVRDSMEDPLTAGD